LRNRKRVSTRFAIVVIAAALATAVLAAGAQAAVRHFDGTVVAKSSAPRSVTVRTESGAKLTFKITSGTEFERIAFGGLAKGTAIEIDATNASGSWVATHVEPQGGNGGGDDNGGADDHGGHGNEDGPGHT
jgi:hypothetical protein